MYLIFSGIKHDNNQALNYLDRVIDILGEEDIKEYGKKFFTTELECEFKSTGLGTSIYVGKDWLNVYDLKNQTAHYFELQDPYALKPIIYYCYNKPTSIDKVPRSELDLELIEIYDEN